MAAAGGTAEDKELLDALRSVAEPAGQAILDSFLEASSVLNLEQRPDGTPITNADLASEELIIAALQRLSPSIPVLSEERLLQQGTSWPLPERYWLVDPLDGTEQFLSQNAEFSVNIALIVGGRPAAGIIHAPALDMTWAGAGPGSAAFSHKKEPPRVIATRVCPPEGGVVFLHRYQGTQASLDYAREHYAIAKHVKAGGGMIFGFLAAGQADYYARLEPTYEWSSAAGQAVLQAAGGSVLDRQGAPLAYGKSSLLTNGYLARGVA
ncbi:MAG: 3'(2'),5'-bisphosphate nucleotidase CysQ [Pseudomonadota bacterium]